MVELDNGHQQDFESKLAEALVEMRSQHELQIKMYKEEVEKTFNAKVGPSKTRSKRSELTFGRNAAARRRVPQNHHDEDL